MRTNQITALIFILLFFSGFSETLFAGDTIVSSAADISAAMQTAQPGDTLTMTEGTWTDQRIVFQGNGIEGDSILLRASRPGYVILTGTSTLRISGDYLKVDGLYFKDGHSVSGAVIEFRGGPYANFSRLTNTAIVNYNPSSKNTDYKWISMYGTYNRVDRCYVRGKNHSGTTLVVWLNGQPNYHRIDHNYFAYRPELGFNGGETIRVGTSQFSMTDSYTTVESNYFEHCNGEIEIISNKSGHNIYRYNTFFESQGTLTLRHGNFATVTGNFFFGNFKSQTGGVRVIGEDHLVYNNYFQDLAGSGYRSALTLMNGVPNSPLNRYFQVKRARILFNTFVNCNETMELGGGSNSELTLPPLDCVIANNAVSTTTQMINQVDVPVNLTWEGNIMFGGPLGITQPAGITIADPLYSPATDGFFRPDSAASPLWASAAGNYPAVVTDMDGQPRVDPKDVGADQQSQAQIIHRPLTKNDVGPDWWLAINQPTVVQISAGIDSLSDALNNAQSGDIIELITPGGQYDNTHNLTIDKNITIRAASGLSQQPVIRQVSASTSTRIIFEIKQGGSLNLKGLDLDGLAGSATPAKYLVRTDDQPMSGTYKLIVDSCYFHDVVLGSEGNFFRAYSGTRADTIRFMNTKFFNSGKQGIRMNDESSGSGEYNANYFEMTNCTMWHTNQEAIAIYAGDDVPFTPGPVVRINHVTFDDCGYSGTPVINTDEVDDTQINNSIISNSPGAAAELYGLTASISYSDIFNSGTVQVNRSAFIGTGMLAADPQYFNAATGDFTLAQTSPVWFKGDDGKAMGDLRWATDPPNAIDDTNVELPKTFEIKDNYPNPFNPQTQILFTTPQNGLAQVQIFDAQGAWVTTLLNKKVTAGQQRVIWTAKNNASGVYFAVIKFNRSKAALKMLLVK